MKHLPAECIRHPDVPLVYVARVWVRPTRGADYERGWKVGSTTSLVARIRLHLCQTTRWFTLCGLAYGSFDVEREIHRRLDAFRARDSVGRTERYVAADGVVRWFEREFPAAWRGEIDCRALLQRTNGTRTYRSPWVRPTVLALAGVVNTRRPQSGWPLMPTSEADVSRWWDEVDALAARNSDPAEVTPP